MRLSVVIPVFNEEQNLRPLHQRLAAAVAPLSDDWEFIFVDDGSRDGSLGIIRDLAARDRHVKYISLSRNFGHELASTAGLDRASGDAVVLIDADLQDPPEVIADLVEKWKGGAQVVYAQRRARSGESIFKRGTAFLFYRLLGALSDVKIPRDTGDFRLMDRRVVEALKRCRENPRFVRGLVSWVGFRQEAVLYDRAPRHAGETKYHLVKLLRLSLEAIAGFSLVPLRLTIWAGLAVTLLSVVLTLMIVAQKFTGHHFPWQGYALLACAIFFLGGVQLIMLGMVAHYVGHIFRHSQARPLYVVAAEHGFGAGDGRDGAAPEGTAAERERPEQAAVPEAGSAPAP